MSAGFMNRFKQHLFRNLLGMGTICGGLAGCMLCIENEARLFWIIMGAGGGLYLGFLCALFARD